jgi:murein DD-endopeptidase MepM/ murein hydrolase activator NlpD
MMGVDVGGEDGMATSITLRMWSDNGGVTGNVRLKLYDSSGTHFASTGYIDSSTITSYSGSSWYPISGTGVGGLVTFTFSTPVQLPSYIFYVTVDASGVNYPWQLYYGTGYGTGWDPSHNVVCYQGTPGGCVASQESADIQISFMTLELAYPLGEVRTSSGYEFGDNWAYGECPSSVLKVHTGIDYTATNGDDVFAAEDGIVKIIISGGSTWANAIVIEHTHSEGWKYTTVYWHVNSLVAENDSVDKGEHIADVADIAFDHLHFGLRIADYVSVVSGVGALPTSNCSIWPAFPDRFVNTANPLYVIFE